MTKYHTVKVQYGILKLRYGIFTKGSMKIPYRKSSVWYFKVTVWYFFKSWVSRKYHTEKYSMVFCSNYWKYHTVSSVWYFLKKLLFFIHKDFPFTKKLLTTQSKSTFTITVWYLLPTNPIIYLLCQYDNSSEKRSLELNFFSTFGNSWAATSMRPQGSSWAQNSTLGGCAKTNKTKIQFLT